ncbi:MAG: CPBP family intramembrane glutamic endopeptidase [Terriglobales bacterium]
MDNKKLPLSSPDLASRVSIDEAAPASFISQSAPEVASVPRESPLRDIFSGPAGLYPGTRWFIYLAMAFVVFQLEGWLLSSRSHPNDLWSRMMIEAAMMLAAIFPAFVMARIEGHQFGDFGLPTQYAFGRNFWAGTLWGIASLSVLMLALRVAGAFEFGSLALHGPRIWKFALYYLVLFLLTAIFEDFLMRGYSQWVLSRGMYFWPTAALLSVAFGYIHGANPGEAKTGLAAAALIGFFLCLTLRRTGNLWWAIGFHMSWDWGETYLYSVPDSGTVLPGHLLNSNLHGPEWLAGGSVGPEGSYLVFAIIGALWVLFDRAYPDVKYGRDK